MSKKWMIIGVGVALSMLIMFIVYMTASTEKHISGKFNDLYWNGYSDFTVAVVSNNQIKFRKLPNLIPTKIYIDAVSPESMWYECNYLVGANHRGIITIPSKIENVDNYGCHVHIHSKNNIKTSGWDHGKFGSGTTVKF